VALEDRKLTELAEKLASVSRELSEWKRQSEESGPLEKHHTQVRAIANALETFADGIRGRLAGAADSSSVLGRAVSIEMMILELHRIWEFFRSKLALRYVPWFQSYLLAADELAWSCYQPIQRWTGADVGKEPPLVFFNGGSSPLTLPRGAAYAAEDVPGEALRTEQFRAALRHLPIPVIGVPWFQIQHLPDAPVIGHEVGHDVEVDLGLTQRLQTLLDEAFAGGAVDEARRTAWHAWLGEVFADVYGALSTGPAYGATLIDFLAADARAVASEAPAGPEWGAYPTRALRVLIAAAVVERCGLEQEARDLRERWNEAYPSHALAAFENDVSVVVDALLQGPYPELEGGGLKELVCFEATQQAQAIDAAEEANDGRAPPADDVRVLAAAARLAFDASPEKYAKREAARRFLRKIEGVQKVGTRAAGDPGSSEHARDQRDLAAGQLLLALVSQAHETAEAEEGDQHV
jgi:hypothetical protein